MTYEYAVYFKLLLLCGYKDELQRYIDDALVTQETLSEIVLELSTVNSDEDKILSVLNEYLRQTNDADIDYNTVFDYVMSFLKRKYTNDAMPIGDITRLMYKLAVYTKRYMAEPWYTMYLMGDLFDEAEANYIDKEDYLRKLEDFINNNVCFGDYPSSQPKENFFQRLIKKIRSNH